MAKQRNYLNNPDLLKEIKESKINNQLTPKASELLILLAKKTIKKLPYVNPDDRDDCLQQSYHDLFKYWRGFNPEKSDNPFSYFTSIIFKGAFKGWGQLHPQKYKDTISLSGAADGDGIYSL